MRKENGVEIYEKGDFDNFAFYGFMGAFLIGFPVCLYTEDAGFTPVAAVIGMAIWCLKYVVLSFFKRTSNGGDHES